MSLKEQERTTLVNLYLSKCNETLDDARLTRDQGRWNASANRLYYALFHAITALFVSDGIPCVNVQIMMPHSRLPKQLSMNDLLRSNR